MRQVKLWSMVVASMALWALVTLAVLGAGAGPGMWLRMLLLGAFLPGTAGDARGAWWWGPTLIVLPIAAAGIAAARLVRRRPLPPSGRWSLLVPAALTGCLLWLYGHQRVVALPVLVWLVFDLTRYARRRVSLTRVAAVAGLFALASLSPVDVTCRAYPGPPHLIPVVEGLPDGNAIAAMNRGEIFLSGCSGAPIASWLWVW